MKRHSFIFSFVLLVVFLGGCTAPLLEVCPDAWIINEMPCVYETDPRECEEPVREYFILDGSKVEASSFNKTWVEENCLLTPEIVS